MRTKRRTINLIFLLLIAATAVVSQAHGQVNTRDGLDDYIQRNEELLAEAAELVRGTNSAKARASLDAAYQLHLASKSDFESDRLVSSAVLARRARDAIQKAIQLAKRETKLEENAYKAIDRAARRNEQARTLYDESGARDNIPARKLIDESLNQLLRARASVQEHMFEVAIQSAKASFDMSNRAIGLLKRDAVGPELVRREITRTDRLLDRIDERAGEVARPDLHRLLEEAHQLQNRARADAAEGRYILAFEETRRAREIARRIINRAGGAATDPESVLRALELTESLISRAFEIARENGDERAAAQLEEATRIQRSAREMYGGGQTDRAAALTRQARDLAQRAARSMQTEINDDTVRGALERTDDVLAGLRERLDGTADRTAGELYERASVRQRSAWESFAAGELRRALANTKVARNLASTALRQLNDG